jgi:hypothetical protein
MFQTAKYVLLYAHRFNLNGAGSGSSSSSSSSSSSALVNLDRLFSAFTAQRLLAVGSAGASTVSGRCIPSDAAAAAAAADSNSFAGCSDADVPSLALAMHHALLTALEPPAAAALAVRSLLQKSVKVFTSLKKDCLGRRSLSPQALQNSRAMDKSGGGVQEAKYLQVT